MLFAINTAYGGEKALHAHEHGSLKIQMAVEKNAIEISIDGPSEAFIGFEYAPKTPKEKKIFDDAKNLWEKSFFNLVSMDQSLNCQVTEAEFKQVLEEKSTHSDIEAKVKINCAKDPVGSTVTVSFKKYFKNIKKLSVELLSNETKNFKQS
jgi:hypothetical protein